MTCVKYSSLNRCQTCLGDPVDTSTLESLHVSDDMTSLLNYCNIKIFEGLPNAICIKCVQTFESIITFKHQCLVSQTVLQNLYKEYLTSYETNEQIPAEDYKKVEPVSFTNIKVEQIKEEQNEGVDSLSCGKTENVELDDKNNTYLDTLDDNDNDDDDGNYESEKEEPVTKKQTKKQGSISCSKCRFTCNTLKELDNHSQNRHDTTCSVCNKKLVNTRNLRRHRQIHEQDRPQHYCEICKKFYEIHTFKYHMRKFHSNVNREKIVCSLCGVAVYEIKHHMRSKHSDSKDQFPCTYCKKVFKSHTRLRAHAVIYHENSEHYKSLCPECGKVFRTPSDMRSHLKRKHSDERNYPCRHCEKAFKTTHHRSRHEKIVHFHERRYKCEICLKAFTEKNVLDNHIRTHTGEKPFVCSLCSRGFAQKVTLTTHMRLVHNLGTNKSTPKAE